jgi:hypothetical protein
MDWLNWAASICSILSVLFSLLAWLKAKRIHKELIKEQQRQNKKIKVILNYGDKKLELPMELRRVELTRAEILGRLGMIPMKGKGQQRFSLGYINKPEFLQQINNIAVSDGEFILTIPCNEDEFSQFDIKSNLSL